MILTSKGRGLETTVIASQRNIIAVEKTTAAVIHKRGGGIIRTRGLPDFVGTVCGSGRSIMFDAKECRLEHRWPVRSQLAPHQREYLIRHGAAGALAGVLVEDCRGQRYRWLPWEALRVDEASVAWADPRWVDLGPTTHAIQFERLMMEAEQ